MENTALSFVFQDNPYKHQLKCRYRSRMNSPGLILSPVKEEEVYLDPWIVIYHDVISQSEMESLKDIAFPLVCSL